MKKNFREEKGITLIALVITIIILIILAGVAINLTLGDNGIFYEAKYAKEKYKNATQYEEISLKNYENKISQYVNGSNRENLDYDESIYDVWTTWLSLAGVENPKQYNANKILSNQSLMQLTMNSDKALEYMKNSREFILPRVYESQIALTELDKSNKLVKIPKLEANIDKIIADGIIGENSVVENTYQIFDRKYFDIWWFIRKNSFTNNRSVNRI